MGLLDGKVCLVTGTHRGIGAAILRHFVEEGAIVYANARAEGCIDARCKELASNGKGTAVPVYFDVTDTPAIKSCIMRIKKEQGRLDVLVNNAAVMQDAMLGMISDEMIDSTFAVNVVASIQLMQYANKLMSRQNSGSIINFASLVATNGNAGQVLYAASKGAVIAMTKAAAKELAPKGIRVNAVAPGMIDTDLFRSSGEETVKRFSAQIGMGRVGLPDEVADTCVFLASDLSSYVTGQTIGIDGAALM